MNRIIFILLATLLLSRGWFLFSDEHQMMVNFWDRIGIDIRKPYDVHPFYDYPKEIKGEKLKWIAHDTGYLLTFILLMYIIKTTVHSSKPYQIIIGVVYYFSIFRLLEFWLFRFHIGLTSITLAIILYSLFNFKNGKRSSV